MKYTPAPAQIVKLVKTTAEKHHTRLNGAKIAVIMRDKAAKRKGLTIFATASLVPERLRTILKDNYSFVIVIAEDAWLTLDAKKRAAVVDHELCHCRLSDAGKPEMIPHDYEEFACIVKRHGLWRGDDTERALQMTLSNDGVVVETID